MKYVKVNFIYLRKSAFAILPLLYSILSFIFLSRAQHFYISDFDFSYPYLINGTNIASGHFQVGNIYHPGTPVEIFAALVISIKHLFTTNTIVLYQDVLMHSENYLFTCNIILVILLSLTTYFAGIYVYRNSKNLSLALVFQISPLLYNEIVKRTDLLSADAFISIIGLFFMPYLYVNTICQNQFGNEKIANKTIILFGLFTALLFTTKIYCGPVILLVLFMVKKNKQRILYLVSTGIFSLILLFPLYNQLRNWAGSIKSMMFHTGPYGQGNSGIIDYALYKNNLVEIFDMHHLFTAVYLLVLIAFLVNLWSILRKKTFTDNFILPITGILIYFSLFILLIAKQYEVTCPNPLTHTITTITKFYYFILLLCSFPLAINISYKILFPALASFKFFNSHKQKIFYTLFGFFVILGLRQTYETCYEARNQNVSLEKTCSFISKWKWTPLIIVADGGDQVRAEPALFLGSCFAGKWNMSRYFDFLKNIYPNTYIYSIGWRDALTFWGDETNISSILGKNNRALVYTSGSDSLADKITLGRICASAVQKTKPFYKKIYISVNKYESIYLIQADTSYEIK